MVTLICTKHNDNGACNSFELFKIIKQINPDVIFEEIPPSLFDCVYNGRCTDTLETISIKNYLRTSTATQIPVDLEIENNTRQKIQEDFNRMFQEFYSLNSEYNSIKNQINILVNQYGFPYLNSEKCSELFNQKKSLEEEIVKSIRLENLTLSYKNWLNLIERREDKMVSNIYSFSKLNSFKNGLFLVGAEHRHSIINRILEYEKNNENVVSWNFKYFNLK
jgi:hypothetical protein